MFPAQRLVITPSDGVISYWLLPRLTGLLVIGLVLSFLIIPKSVFAQGIDPTPPNQGGVTVTANSYTPHIHTGLTFQNLISNFAGCLIAGKSLVSQSGVPVGTGTTQINNCPVYGPNGQLLGFSKVPDGGAIGGTGKVLAFLYNTPPTSTTEYLADLGRQMGIVDTAYAQGLGTSGDYVLRPILDLWRMMRNLAYLLFILIFVAVGVMIMFRRKINPQTVISVQTALPGLVIGLILVTFSYLIASFIVDLSFFGMRIVAFIFQQSGMPNIINEGTVFTKDVQQLSTQSNIFQVWWSFMANNSLVDNIIMPISSYFNITETVKGFFTSTVGTVNIFGLDVGGVIAGTVGSIGEGLGLIGGLILAAIIIIGLLIQLIRLAWALISAYITIFIMTIAGPLLIAFGSIPGQGGAISYWWKTLLANVLIFPAVFFVFLFAGTFLATVNPTQMNSIALPFFSGLTIPVINALIGYGLVLATPAVPGLVKQALGVKDIGAIQQAGMAGIAAGFAPVKAGVQRAYKPYKTQFEAGQEAIRRKYYQEVEAGTAISERGELTNMTGLKGILWRRFYKPSIPLKGGKPQGSS